MRLEPFVPENLWVVQSPLQTYGLEIGTRMTLCRLNSGELWVHSPICLNQALGHQINALGPVRFVVAPNRHHHFFIKDFINLYPNALLYGSPDLPQKRPDLKFDGVLGNNAEWQPDLDQVWIQGNCFHDEVVFFHRRSQTLIVADLCMSGVPEQPLLTRLVLWMLGIYQKPGPPIDVKFAYLNQKAARDSFNKLMEWDFDRMILAHGPLIHTNAKSVLSQAYQFLLG